MSRFFSYTWSFFFCWPLLGVFIWKLSGGFEYRVLIGCLAAALAEHYIYVTSVQVQRERGLKALDKWLVEYVNFAFIERSIADYGVTDEAAHLLRRGFGMRPFQNLGMSIEIYQVVCPNPPIPTAVKAFAIGGKCVIFVRDPPGSTQDYARFLIFHELGHAYPITAAFWTVQECFIHSLILLGFVSFSVVGVSIPVLIGLLVYALSRLLFVWRGGSYRLSELSADQFAAYCLRDRISLNRVADLLQRFEAGSTLTRARVAQLRAMAKAKMDYHRPEVPEFPLAEGVLSAIVVVLLGMGWNIDNLPKVIFCLFGIAFAHRVVAGYLARIVRDKEAATLWRIDMRWVLHRCRESQSSSNRSS